MLLIRPWIAMNRNHFGGIHTASFIFAVSNIGGELLPVGPSIAVAACLISPRQIHRANEFTLAPIKEAAWIFLGIFGTTIPVLDYMAMHAVQLGLRSDLQFYGGTALLSALLDNTRPYLTFLAGALGLQGLSMDNAARMSEFIARHNHYLVAISHVSGQ